MSTAYTMQTAPKRCLITTNIGRRVLNPHHFCRCHEKKWINSVGMRVTLFWFVVMPILTIHHFVSGVIGRVLEAQGFRVGIIAQPDWTNVESFRVLGKPTIAWGVTAGNMDSMINRYTADRKIVPMMLIRQIMNRINVQTVQQQFIVSVAVRLFLTFRYCLVVLKVALRRIAHYDYWSDKVRSF